jgi:hypothetical protein
MSLVHRESAAFPLGTESSNSLNHLVNDAICISGFRGKSGQKISLRKKISVVFLVVGEKSCQHCRNINVCNDLALGTEISALPALLVP